MSMTRRKIVEDHHLDEFFGTREDYSFGKDAFRPSNVKRRIKANADDCNTNNGSLSLVPQKNFIKLNQNNLNLNINSSKLNKFNISKLLRHNKSSASSLNINTVEKLNDYFTLLDHTGNPNSANQNGSALRLNIAELSSEDDNNNNTKHKLICYSPINTPTQFLNRPKSELVTDALEKRIPSSSVNYRFSMPPKSAESKGTSYFKTETSVASFKINNHEHSRSPSTESNDKTNKIIKNLSENEFLEFLKEYRRTKSINLDYILTIKSKLNEQESEEAAKSGEQPVEHLTKPPKNSFEKIDTPRSNANKFQPIPLPAQTNFFYNQSNKNSRANINPNDMSINVNRSSEYLTNYLNRKIVIKNSKNLVGLIKNGTSTNGNNNDNHSDTNGNQTQTNFQRIKILNFPAAFAN